MLEFRISFSRKQLLRLINLSNCLIICLFTNSIYSHPNDDSINLEDNAQNLKDALNALSFSEHNDRKSSIELQTNSSSSRNSENMLDQLNALSFSEHNDRKSSIELQTDSSSSLNSENMLDQLDALSFSEHNDRKSSIELQTNAVSSTNEIKNEPNSNLLRSDNFDNINDLNNLLQNQQESNNIYLDDQQNISQTEITTHSTDSISTDDTYHLTKQNLNSTQIIEQEEQPTHTTESITTNNTLEPLTLKTSSLYPKYTFCKYETQKNDLATSTTQDFKSLNPQNYHNKRNAELFANGAIYSALNFLNTAHAILTSRLKMLDDFKTILAPASGNDENNFILTKKIWLKGFKISSKLKQDHSTLKNNQRGFLLGIDTEITPNIIAGIAYGFSHSTIKSIDSFSNLHPHDFQLIHIAALYATFNVSTKFFINTQLKYGKTFITANIYTDNSKTYGKTFGQLFSTKVEAGYKLIYDSITFIPKLGLRFDDIHIKGFSQQNIGISSQHNDKLLTNIDLEIIKPIIQNNQNSIIAKASLNIDHLLLVKNKSPKITLLDTDQYILSSNNKLPTIYTLGASLVASNNNLEFAFNHMYSFKPKKFQSNFSSLSVSIKF